MSERLTDMQVSALIDHAESRVDRMTAVALRELRERRAADLTNADQARHWQRETERVSSLRDSHEARLVELFLAAHAGPVEIAADLSGEVARVVNAIRINARETERVKQELAGLRGYREGKRKDELYTDGDYEAVASNIAADPRWANRADSQLVARWALRLKEQLATVQHALANAEQAAMLSDVDFDVLNDIRSRINANYDSTLDYINDVQLALLDRLLSRGEDGR